MFWQDLVPCRGGDDVWRWDVGCWLSVQVFCSDLLVSPVLLCKKCFENDICFWIPGCLLWLRISRVRMMWEMFLAVRWDNAVGQRHLFQLCFQNEMNISHGTVLGSGLLKACGFAYFSHAYALVWSSLSPVDALVVCWGMAACGLLKSAHEGVTAPCKRPVPLASHKIHALYLVQLVIFINHVDSVAMQRNT